MIAVRAMVISALRAGKALTHNIATTMDLSVFNTIDRRS